MTCNAVLKARGVQTVATALNSENVENCELSEFSLVHVATMCDRRRYTRKSSGDEIANVNFLTTTPSTTFVQCATEATEIGEITQNKGQYAVQGHSRSPILVPIESSYTTSY